MMTINAEGPRKYVLTNVNFQGWSRIRIYPTFLPAKFVLIFCSSQVRLFRGLLPRHPEMSRDGIYLSYTWLFGHEDRNLLSPATTGNGESCNGASKAWSPLSLNRPYNDFLTLGLLRMQMISLYQVYDGLGYAETLDCFRFHLTRSNIPLKPANISALFRQGSWQQGSNCFNCWFCRSCSLRMSRPLQTSPGINLIMKRSAQLRPLMASRLYFTQVSETRRNQDFWKRELIHSRSLREEAPVCNLFDCILTR